MPVLLGLFLHFLLGAFEDERLLVHAAGLCLHIGVENVLAVLIEGLLQSLNLFPFPAGIKAAQGCHGNAHGAAIHAHAALAWFEKVKVGLAYATAGSVLQPLEEGPDVRHLHDHIVDGVAGAYELSAQDAHGHWIAGEDFVEDKSEGVAPGAVDIGDVEISGHGLCSPWES